MKPARHTAGGTPLHRHDIGRVLGKKKVKSRIDATMAHEERGYVEENTEIETHRFEFLLHSRHARYTTHANTLAPDES